jgi:hypothetical protein
MSAEQFPTPLPPLPVLHSLGGCGGTPVAKCLGSMPGIVLLSETNPDSARLFDGSLNARNQVREWYPEIFAALPAATLDTDLTRVDAFREFIRAVYDVVQTQGKTLVLRDYNYVDYFGVPFTREPRGASILRSALEQTFSLTSAVLVRHPLRQYDSLRSHRSAENVLRPRIFLDGYAAFMRDFVGAYRITYEEFIAEPAGAIEGLCRFLCIPYSETFIDRFTDYRAVTGNLGRQNDPTISHATWEPAADEWRTELQGDPAFSVLLERLGYAANDSVAPALPPTKANTPERVAAKIAAQDRDIRALRSALARQSALLAEAPWEAVIAELRSARTALEDTCAERADLIDRLTAEIAARDATCADLQAACAERADLIDRLSAEVDMLRTAADERVELLERVSAEAARRAELLDELTGALEGATRDTAG